MRRTLIGHTGVIGNTLKNQFKFSRLYNSQNIGSIVDTKNDFTICAAPSAKKWLINKNPTSDILNIFSIFDKLNKSTHKKIILISTIDCLKFTIGNNENPYYDFKSNNYSYGFNRIILEKFIINRFSDFHIIRIPAIFGKNINKNSLFDLKNERVDFIKNISLESYYQWFNLQDLKKVILYAIDKNIKILNCFSEPIKMRDIVQKYFNKYVDICNSKNIVKYDFTTSYNQSGYFFNKSKILSSMELYIND